MADIKIAYKLFGVSEPLALHQAYCREDQRLFREKLWDYENSDLLINRTRRILEEIDPDTLTPDEEFWREEILWFWYHHAISCAIWKRDRETACIYAEIALEYQTGCHPNKITRLLYFFVNDRIEEAIIWAKSILEEPEKSTAADLLEEYKQTKFFLP